MFCGTFQFIQLELTDSVHLFLLFQFSFQFIKLVLQPLILCQRFFLLLSEVLQVLLKLFLNSFFFQRFCFFLLSQLSFYFLLRLTFLSLLLLLKFFLVPLILLLHLLNLLLLFFSHYLLLFNLAGKISNFLFPNSQFFSQSFKFLCLIFCVSSTLDLNSLSLVLFFKFLYLRFQFCLQLTLLSISSLPVNSGSTTFLRQLLYFCKFVVQFGYLVIILLDLFLCVLDLLLSSHN